MFRLIQRFAQCAILVLFTAALIITHAYAQTTEPPVVGAVIFTSQICTSCGEIVEKELPLAIRKYDSQVQILIVDIDTPEGMQLYQAALEAYGVERSIPLLFVDQTTLNGMSIVTEFPTLVEAYLRQGGMDWPDIPGLVEYWAMSQLNEVTATELPLDHLDQSIQPSEHPMVVSAVLFWMEGCPLCHKVIEDVLLPQQEKYGPQLDIRVIELMTLEEVELFYEMAASYGIPRDQVGVPLLIIGDQVLIGGEQIPDALPGLIEDYLKLGGVGLPGIAPLDNSLLDPAPNSWPPTVHLLLFWTSDCHACRVVVDEALIPLREQYGDQIAVQYVDVVNSEDVEHFYEIAAAYGIPKEEADLPMVLIADQALVGSDEIISKLPGLVSAYLAEGGTKLPDITDLVRSEATAEAVLPARPDGFWVAAGATLFMILVLSYALIALFRRNLPVPPIYLTNFALPLLVLIGLVLAGYLAYVETQALPAVCGPVGDCNTVQASPYARLFGVLPIGVLGVIGYLMILIAWAWYRLRRGSLSSLAAVGLLGMTLFGTLFSIYLTGLELFVIKAICIWCVTSAVIMALLLLLSLEPALCMPVYSNQTRKVTGDIHSCTADDNRVIVDIDNS